MPKPEPMLEPMLDEEKKPNVGSAPATVSEPILDEEDTINVGSAPATVSTPSLSTGAVGGVMDKKADFLKVFPFAAVDFFVSESRPNGEKDLGPNEHTKTHSRDKYLPEPTECTGCAELFKTVQKQEREIA